MASVRIGAEKDVTATPEEQISYWLDIWLNRQVDVGIRCTAAKRLDELLRAPVWPT